VARQRRIEEHCAGGEISRIHWAKRFRATALQMRPRWAGSLDEIRLRVRNAELREEVQCTQRASPTPSSTPYTSYSIVGGTRRGGMCPGLCLAANSPGSRDAQRAAQRRWEARPRRKRPVSSATRMRAIRTQSLITRTRRRRAWIIQAGSKKAVVRGRPPTAPDRASSRNNSTPWNQNHAWCAQERLSNQNGARMIDARREKRKNRKRPLVYNSLER